MSGLRSVQRALYFASRFAGDAAAAQRGPDALAKRLARRTITRTVFRVLGNRTSR